MAWLYKCAEALGRDHGDRGKKDQLKHFVLIQPAIQPQASGKTATQYAWMQLGLRTGKQEGFFSVASWGGNWEESGIDWVDW